MQKFKLVDDTPMLMIWLQRIRIKTRSAPTRGVIMEAEHRCKYYEQLLKAARSGNMRELRLIVEAIDIIRAKE